MTDKQLQKSEREARILKRAVLLVGSLVVLLILGVFSVLLNRHIDEQERQDRAGIYGVWIEQNVPKFARDRFIVREEGIYVEERIIDTQYTFDGSELRYEYEGSQYVYKVEGDTVLTLRRIEPTHYISTFHLQGSESVEQLNDEDANSKEPLQ